MLAPREPTNSTATVWTAVKAKSQMPDDATLPIVVGCTVAAAAVVVGLLALLIWYVRSWRRSKQHGSYEPVLNDAERAAALAGQAGASDVDNKKKKWKARIIHRGTASFPFASRKEKPEMVLAGSAPGMPTAAINQQLGPAQQQGAAATGVQTVNGTFGVDVSLYRSLVNSVRLDTLDEEERKPLGEDRGLGDLTYALKYDFENQNLEVRAVRANGLLAKDISGTSDPYVKVMITPGSKKYCLESKIKMKTLNPVWKETFYFEGFPLSKLESKTLVLQVLDFDRFSKDDPIGEIEIKLSDVNLCEPVGCRRYLAPCQGDRRGLGELQVSLCYNSVTGKLTVAILQARNLKAKDVNGSSDPYVKLWHKYQGAKVEKKKTSIKMKTLNPVYNETFVFDVPLDRIKDTGIHIHVMDYDKWSSNDRIGELLLSSKSGDPEKKHWNAMLSSPKQLVTNWQILRQMT